MTNSTVTNLLKNYQENNSEQTPAQRQYAKHLIASIERTRQRLNDSGIGREVLDQAIEQKLKEEERPYGTWEYYRSATPAYNDPEVLKPSLIKTLGSYTAKDYGVKFIQGLNNLPDAIATTATEVVAENIDVQKKFGVVTPLTVLAHQAQKQGFIPDHNPNYQPVNTQPVHEIYANVTKKQERREALNGWLSDGAKQRDAEVAKEIAQIDDGNWVTTNAKRVSHLVKNPDVLAGDLAQSLPSMGVAVATRSPLAVGTALEGTSAFADVYEHGTQLGVDPQTTRDHAFKAGIVSGAITFGGGKLGQRFGLGDIDTVTTSKTIPKTVGSILANSVEEGLIAQTTLGETNLLSNKNYFDDEQGQVARGVASGGFGSVAMDTIPTALGLASDGVVMGADGIKTVKDNLTKGSFENQITAGNKHFNPTKAYQSAYANLQKADNDEDRQKYQTQLDKSKEVLFDYYDRWFNAYEKETDPKQKQELYDKVKRYEDLYIKPFHQFNDALTQSQEGNTNFTQDLIDQVTQLGQLQQSYKQSDEVVDNSQQIPIQSHNFTDIGLNKNGTQLGKQLGFKTNVKQDAFAGGTTKADTIAFAKVLDDDGLGGIMKNFSAFNDGYHKGTTSKHTQGIKIDLSLKDDSIKAYQKARQQVINLARQHGYDVTVVAEHKQGASQGIDGFAWYKRSTGSHLDITVKGRVAQGQNTQTKPTASTTIQKIITPKDGTSITVELSDGTVVKRTGTRAWRNNNAGNLEYGDFAKANGAIGSDGRFAIFPDKATGDKAREKLIFESKRYKDLTLSQAIKAYAPPNENDTATYTKAVLKAVNGQDKKMSDYTANERKSILQAIQTHEGYEAGQEIVIKAGNNPTYTKQHNLLNSQLADLQNQLQSADDNQTQALQAQIDDLQNQLESLEAQPKNNQEIKTKVQEIKEQNTPKIIKRFSQMPITDEASHIQALSEIEQLQQAGLLNKAQADGLRQLSEIKLKVMAADMDSVARELMSGRQGSTNEESALGLEQYATLFNTALAHGGHTQLDKHLAYLQRWSDNHTSKMHALNQAYYEFDGTNPIYIAPVNGNWQQVNRHDYTDGQWYKARGLTVDYRSKNLVEQLNTEAPLLQEFTHAWTNILTKELPNQDLKAQVKALMPKKPSNKVQEAITQEINQALSQEQPTLIKQGSQDTANKNQGFYIGRSHDGKSFKSMSNLNNPNNKIQVGDKGWLGNPFNVGEARSKYHKPTQEEANQAYIDLFKENFAKDDNFAKGVLDLKNKALYGNPNNIETKFLNELLPKLSDDINTAKDQVASIKGFEDGIVFDEIKKQDNPKENKPEQTQTQSFKLPDDVRDTNEAEDDFNLQMQTEDELERINQELNQQAHDDYDYGEYDEYDNEVTQEVEQEKEAPKERSRASTNSRAKKESTNTKAISQVKKSALKKQDEVDLTGVQTLSVIIDKLDLEIDEKLILQGISKRYPDIKVSLDKSGDDTVIKADKPEILLQKVVAYSTNQIIAVLADDVSHDKELLQLKDDLTIIKKHLKNLKNLDEIDSRKVKEALQSDEKLIAMAVADLNFKMLLKRVEFNNKVKSSLFTQLVMGLKSFLGIVDKQTVNNLYEHTIDTIGSLIEFQVNDNQTQLGKLSVLKVFKQDRQQELAKPIFEQNMLKAGIIQGTKQHLNQVADLSDRLRTYGEQELRRLGIEYHKQGVAQLEHYLAFEEEFIHHLIDSFQAKKDGWQWQDMKSWLQKEDGSFDKNLLTAMSLTAYETLFIKGGKRFNTPSDVAKILRQDEDTPIPNEVYDVYAHMGEQLQFAIADMGKQITQALELKQTDDVPSETLTRLQASLGGWLVSAMQMADLVHILEIPSDVHEYYIKSLTDITVEFPKEINEHKNFSFLSFTDKDGENANPIIDDIIDHSKQTNGFLSKVYGKESLQVFPTLKPTTQVDKNIRDSHSKVGDTQAQRIAKMQSEPIVINQTMHQVLSQLNDLDNNYLLDLIGGRVTEEDLNKLHSSKRKSAEAKAEGIARDLAHHFEWVESLPTPDTPFFDSIKTAINNRMHYKSNFWNFQSSTTQRAFGEYANFKQTLDLNVFDGQTFYADDGKPTPITLFFRAVFENAEDTEKYFENKLQDSLFKQGFTVDKLPSNIFMPIALDYLSQAHIQAGVQAMQVLIKDGTANQEQKQAIKTVVDEFGMGARSLRALMELANFYTALNSQDKQLVTSFGLGSDGVNNGMAIGMVYNGIDEEQALNQTGVFKKGGFNSYFDSRTDDTVGDVYTSFSQVLDSEIVNLEKETEEGLKSGEDTEFFEFKKSVLTSLKYLNNTLLDRKTAKAVVIPFGYSAGIARLVQSASEQMTKDIYSRMEKIYHMDKPERDREYKILLNHLRAILGDSFSIGGVNNLLEFNFSPSQEKLLQERYNNFIGKALKNAIEVQFGQFIEGRDFNVALHESNNKVYLTLKEHLTNLAEQKRLAKLKEQYPDEKQYNRAVNYATLTPKEIHEQITKPLEQIFPKVNSIYSAKEKDSRHTAIETIKQENTLAEDKSLDTKTFMYVGDGQKASKTFIGLINKKQEISAGVRPNSQTIQSSDSYFSSVASVADEVVSINVHDANIGNLIHYLKMTVAQNKAFLHGTAQYHLAYENLLGLLTTLEGYVNAKEEGLIKLSPEQEADMLIGMLMPLRKIDFVKEALPSLLRNPDDLVQEVVLPIVKELIDWGIQGDINKLKVYQNTGVIHQYAGEGGEYVLSQKDYDILDNELKHLQTLQANLLDTLTTTLSKLNPKQANKAVLGVHYGVSFKQIKNIPLNGKEAIFDIKDVKKQSEIIDAVNQGLMLIDTSHKPNNYEDVSERLEKVAKWAMENHSHQIIKPDVKVTALKRYRQEPNDLPLPKNMAEITNHSGGAYGADTEWDLIGREFGVVNHQHYRAKDNLKLSKPLKDRKIKAHALSKEQIDTARNLVNQLLKTDYKDSIKGNLQARNYYQVDNADGVFAIAPLLTDLRGVDSGTNTAVQLAIKQQKPVYVWDTNTERWYTHNGKKFVFYKDTPILTKNFAGVGTRDIGKRQIQNKQGEWIDAPYLGDDKANKAKEAIRAVYQATLDKIQQNQEAVSDEQSQNIPKTINIWSSQKNGYEGLSNMVVRPFSYHGLNYSSVEVAYQHHKALFANDNVTAERILKADNAYKAKQLGKQVKNLDIASWNSQRDTIIKDLMKQSFLANPKAKELLLSTGNATLTHTQDKAYWGKRFPELLMELREEFRQVNQKAEPNPNPTNTYPLAKLKKSLTQLSVNKANQTLTTWLIEAMDRFNPNLQVLMVETIPSDVPDNAIAWYESASNQIHIIKDRFDGLSDDDKSMYVLHEMVHALTEHNLNNPKFAKVKEKLIAMHEQLYQAWQDGAKNGFHEEKLKLMLDSRDEQDNILYGEFIAYGLTDKDMQKFIADNLKTDSKTSVLDKFLNIAKQILGLNDKNFAEFVKVSSQLMGEYHPTTQQSLFGLSAMKSLQTNIKRGQEAMHKVLLTKADVKRAMYRNDIGWVDFVWGDTGILKPNGKTKGAMGISHILEARMRKDKMSYDDVVKFLTEDVVETVAQGIVINQRQRDNSENLTLEYQDTILHLVKNKGSNAWILTGYEKNQTVNQSRGATTSDLRTNSPIRSRTDVGASDKTTLSQQNFDDKSTRLYAKAVHTVNQTPTLTLLKNLDSTGLSQEHNAHLDGLIDGLLASYYVYHSPSQRVDVSQGKLKNKAKYARFKATDKESYVTALLEETINTYQNTHQGKLVVNALDDLYKQLSKELTHPRDLYSNFDKVSKEEQAIYKAQFDFIFKAKDKSTARFVAMTLANESFKQLMQSRTTKIKNDRQSLFDKVMGFIQDVLRGFSDLWFSTRGDNYTQIQGYVKALNKLEIQARNHKVDKLQKSWEMMLNVSSKVLDKPIKKGISKAINTKRLRNSKVEFLRTAGKLAYAVDKLGAEGVHGKLKPNERFGELMEIINEVNHNGKVGHLIDEFTRITQTLANERERTKVGTLKTLTQSFNQKLDDKQKSAITKAVLRTDLSGLLKHGFKPKDIFKLLDNKTRQTKLKEYQDKLIAHIKDKKISNDMLHQTKALGLYMAQETTSQHLVKNAEGIVFGLGSWYQGDNWQEIDPTTLELVDVLASLYALEYVLPSDIKKVQKLLSTEAKGLEQTLYLHEEIVNLGRLDFKDNPLNYHKGYTRQLVNPFLDAQFVSNKAEMEQLKKRGYEVVSTLGQDKYDPTETKVLMIHTQHHPNNYVSGALDMYDTTAKGTIVLDDTNTPQSLAKAIKGNLADRLKRANVSVANFDPKITAGAFVPTYRTDGSLLNYRYEMQGLTKDTLLERDNRFDEILSFMHADLVYKPNVAKHQENMAEFLIDDGKNFSKQSDEFILLDFESTDPDVQRVVRMIPYHFRQALQNHYGNAPVPVRASVYNAVFGFNAYSVVQLFDKLDSNERLNFAQKALVNFFKFLFGNKARKWAFNIEQFVQITMSLIKDMIVVRSGGVLLGNIMSNTLLLMTHGINPLRIMTDTVFAWRNGKRYTKAVNQIHHLQSQMMASGSTQEKAKLQRQITQLEQELSHNPLYDYMQAGLMSTIVEDLTIQGEKHFKSDYEKLVHKVKDKVSKPLMTAFDTVLINQGSVGHNFLAEMTQFSDFSAKYTLAKYVQEQAKKKGITDKKELMAHAIYQAQESFINYDIPTSRFLDYANRMGFMMFTKFFLRFQKVLTKLLHKMPATTVLSHMMAEYFDMQGVLDPFILNRLGNPLDESILMGHDAVGDILTLNLLGGLVN